MKKKILSVVSAFALAMTFSAGMTANAYSWRSDLGIKSYDHDSDELDWSLWEDFLKYDLRITDFDSLDSEKQELCKYIYETEMMSKETIVCERARRIVAGEDVGERITLEKLQQYEFLGDYKWLYGDGGIGTKNYKYDDIYYKYNDKLTLFCVPDIKHMEQAYNEYWLDDDGTEFIEAKGEGYGIVPDIRGFAHVDSDGNREWYEFSSKLEYRTIKYDGLTYKVYPDNTLCLTSADYDYYQYYSEWIFIPDEIDGMPVTRIASGAFKDCLTKEIQLPANLEYIEPFAIDNCPNLERVNFPESIKCIASYAFNECHELFHLVINCPNADIFANSFYKCDIKAISINTKSVPYFNSYDYNNVHQVNILDGTKEVDINYLAKRTKISESVSIISGHIYSGEKKDIKVPEYIEILGAFPDISAMYFGSGINSYPDVPLLDEDYSISADNISGYYNTEAYRYALAHDIKFTPLDDLNYGDTNGDGEINIADAVILQKYIHGNAEVGFEADVNKDGYIDIFDMVEIRKMLVE